MPCYTTVQPGQNVRPARLSYNLQLNTLPYITASDVWLGYWLQSVAFKLQGGTFAPGTHRVARIGGSDGQRVDEAEGPARQVDHLLQGCGDGSRSRYGTPAVTHVRQGAQVALPNMHACPSTLEVIKML